MVGQEPAVNSDVMAMIDRAEDPLYNAVLIQSMSQASWLESCSSPPWHTSFVLA